MKNKIGIFLITLFGLILFNSCDYIKKERTVGMYQFEGEFEGVKTEVTMYLGDDYKVRGMQVIDLFGESQVIQVDGTWRLSEHVDFEISLTYKELMGIGLTLYVKDNMAYESLESALSESYPTPLTKLTDLQWEMYQAKIKHKFNLEE